MIEAVHQHGYTKTTVADVIALAGVSRRAFYEQFANKEACFIATYDIVVARARKLVKDAWDRERGWDNRLHHALKALLDDMADRPKGPHLVLVDSLGIGPKGRERTTLALTTFERIVAMAFRVEPSGEEPSPLTVRAIVAGVWHVAFTRMYERREKELYALTDELVDWIGSYRSPAARHLNLSGVLRSSGVEPRPAAFLASVDRRSRALGALVHLMVDERYSELSDPQIAQFANISIEDFHELFDDKEECFLAVLDEFAAEAMEVVKGSIEPASSWPEAVHLAVGALMDYFASHEVLSRLAFTDSFDVGPSMIGRMMRSIEDFTKLLDELGPDAQRGPLIVREAISGAVWGIVSAYSAHDRVRQMPCLVDHLTFLVLAPYIGPKQAIEVIETERKGLPGSA